jgi:hypothetical protein
MNPEDTKISETARASNDPQEESAKPTKRQLVKHELREVFFTVLYLAASLSIVATFKSLILIQHGIDDFTHGYVVAIVLSLALGKVVAIAQKLPIIRAWNDRPLLFSVLYKAVLMTLIMNVACQAEDKLFPAMSHGSESTNHRLALIVAHQLALVSIFIVLFTFRDLDRVLGQGTLFRLFFYPRKSANSA